MKNDELIGSNGLLHNMSSPPNTTISFKTNRFTDPSARVRFVLPARLSKARPSTILRALGDKRSRIPVETAERELREKIERRALRLKIPFVAPVVDQAQPDERRIQRAPPPYVSGGPLLSGGCGLNQIKRPQGRV